MIKKSHMALKTKRMSCLGGIGWEDLYLSLGEMTTRKFRRNLITYQGTNCASCLCHTLTEWVDWVGWEDLYLATNWLHEQGTFGGTYIFIKELTGALYLYVPLLNTISIGWHGWDGKIFISQFNERIDYSKFKEELTNLSRNFLHFI